MSSAAGERRPATIGDKRAQWLRPGLTRALTAAMLTVSLLLGVAVLAVDRLHAVPAAGLDQQGDPVSDEQSRAQVVEAVKQIVTVTGLRPVSAGYSLMSCKDREDPPYQGAVFLTFGLATGVRADAYLETIASALRANGWAEGIPPNDHTFARTLVRDAVTVIVYRQDDDPGQGVLRLYGQCRNMHDHRADNTTWADVTDQVTSGR